MAGLTASVPGIMWLSAYKGPLFLASGLLLAGSALMQWQARNAPALWIQYSRRVVCGSDGTVDGSWQARLLSMR